MEHPVKYPKNDPLSVERDPSSDRHVADLLLNLPVQALYGPDADGKTRIFSVSVVNGPLTMDVSALLTEDDYFDIFRQIDAWYAEVS